MSQKKRKKPEPFKFPASAEFFADPGRAAWIVRDIRGADPDCFNGILSIRRYRVTVELIDEPMEVLIERIRKLWRECKNTHHVHPIRAAAAEFGIELDWRERGRS